MEPIYEVPMLFTERLVLRAFTLADVSAIVELMKDKAISDTTIFIPYPYTEENAIDWIAAHSTEIEEQKGMVFAITLKEKGTLIGSIGLTYNSDNNHAEMGYWIGKPYWNNGFATEAAAEVLAFAFDQLDFNRVHAHYMSSNPSSGRVMDKIGMKHEGTLRDHLYKENTFKDIIIYGILKTEYLSGKKNERQ